MTTPNKIKVEVHDDEADSAFPFIAWVEKIINSVPKENWPDLQIKAWGGPDYPYISVFYERDETPEEVAARVAKETERQRHQAEVEVHRDISTLRRLAAKYPDVLKDAS